LDKRNVSLGSTARQQLARERYYAYIACTRARQRVVLTCARQDAAGAPLNPSPFLAHIQRLFPSLDTEKVPQNADWRESEHPSELVGPLLKNEVRSPKSEGNPKSEIRNPRSAGGATASAGSELEGPAWLASLPAIASVLEQLRRLQNPRLEENLSPAIAARLYGPLLRTSVSGLERFAACPFQFFVHSGLRAEERKRFELDVREQGSFQHDVLARFHEQLQTEGKRWRDIAPLEARERIARIAESLLGSYRDGLLQASEETRFLARVLTESLQDFAETLVSWMQHQYQFDPVAVELAFGEGAGSPGWCIELGEGRRLELRGRIDRVDLCRDEQSDEALCVVVDYKSSQKQLDPVLLAHGLQLQLLSYLNVMRRWPDPQARFGVARLVPAGVFYVSLRGKYDREQTRIDALAKPEEARKLAYRHAGRFDTRALRQLDCRPDAREGDQFNYRLTAKGDIHGNCREALPTAEFTALLDSTESNLQRMGRQIFCGLAEVAPYRKGAATACDQCDYRAICRIDPWTHGFRVLKAGD
jgi:ATP-dependent helicase/nuclease subunit B